MASDPPSIERGRRTKTRTSSRSGVIEGRVRVRDPFDLVRHLAASQTDPKKAVAELIQNSLDAGARSIVVTRAREAGVTRIRILDDGEGFIPEMDRVDALRHVATNIGSSRKKRLSPEERLRLMTQGQYGIGLLGFWCLGEELEIRSSVEGQTPHRLRLVRNRPEFRIEPIVDSFGRSGTWTEVEVSGIEKTVQTQLVGRRLADWLASELRGQLLARDVRLQIEDRIARAAGARSIAVAPPRFLGEKLEGLGPIEMPGRPPLRAEIHFVGGATEPASPLAIYCGGTLVAESFREVGSLGLDHEPWTDPRLTGLVDFPALRVSPGSRRGIVPDETALLFATALASLEPKIEALLESIESKRCESLDRDLVRTLQRVFRELAREHPRFTLLPVEKSARGFDERGDAPDDGPALPGEPTAPPGTSSSLEPDPRQRGLGEELPAGPLATLVLTPHPLRVPCGEERLVTARAVDEWGQPAEGRVVFAWDLQGPAGTFQEEAAEGVLSSVSRARFHASDAVARGILSVVARSGRRIASAHVQVHVEERRPTATEGIPEPELVEAPSSPWRSRVLEGRWQVNSGHPDFLRAGERPSAKLRYLALLFAKEIVQRSIGDPRLADPLEQLVEIAALADSKLGARKPRRTTPDPEATSSGESPPKATH